MTSVLLGYLRTPLPTSPVGPSWVLSIGALKGRGVWNRGSKNPPPVQADYPLPKSQAARKTPRLCKPIIPYPSPRQHTDSAFIGTPPPPPMHRTYAPTTSDKVTVSQCSNTFNLHWGGGLIRS